MQDYLKGSYSLLVNNLMVGVGILTPACATYEYGSGGENNCIGQSCIQNIPVGTTVTVFEGVDWKLLQFVQASDCVHNSQCGYQWGNYRLH